MYDKEEVNFYRKVINGKLIQTECEYVEMNYLLTTKCISILLNFIY